MVRTPDRRHWLTSATALAATLSLRTPLGAATAAPVSDGHWTDPARSRRMPFRLRLPAGDAACPLVLFSHGLGGSVEAGSVWGRPRAFMAFSPSQPRGGRLSLAEAFGAITRPFLAITGSEDGDPFGSQTSGEPRAQVFQGLPPGQRALLWLDGADHMSFAGQDLQRTPVFGPFRRQGPAALRQPVHHALVARISTDWWLAQLQGDAQARTRLLQPGGLGVGDRWQWG